MKNTFEDIMWLYDMNEELQTFIHLKDSTQLSVVPVRSFVEKKIYLSCMLMEHEKLIEFHDPEVFLQFIKHNAHAHKPHLSVTREEYDKLMKEIEDEE